MKVLLVHNYYQSASPSGEDKAFENEVRMQKNNGADVYVYARHNDEISGYGITGKCRLPFESVWSIKTYRDLLKIVKKAKPDVAHFHNIWYLVSPSAYYACRDARVPIVQTLHNYRFFCANGLLFRNGAVCESCIGKITLQGVINACYRSSRIHSVPICLMEGVHRILGTLNKMVDAFIALTEFSRRKYIECGVIPGKLFVKPNVLADVPEPQYTGNGDMVFVGRLSREKGIDTLAAAAKYLNSSRINNSKILLVGDGPLKRQLYETTRAKDIDNIELAGHKEHKEVIEIMRRGRFVILPSLCYESFPLVIMEAYACGKPVVASRIGALAELVEDGKTGLLFEPGNARDLAAKMRWLYEHKDTCVEMGMNARRTFDEKYTACRNFAVLTQIYTSVLPQHQ